MAIKARLEVPTSFHGSDDSTARLIYQCIKDGTSKDAFRDLDWADLRNEYTFTTTGVEYYTLPQDFDRIITDTIWDRTNDRKILGPVSPTKWQDYYSGLSGLTGLQRLCRLAGPTFTQVSNDLSDPRRRLRIYPDEPDDEVTNIAADQITVAFEYISTRYIVNVAEIGSNLSDTWKSDSDYSLIDDDVIEAAALWRVLRALGMSYSDEREEYNALINERASNDSGAETLSMNQVGMIFGANTPDTGYGS